MPTLHQGLHLAISVCVDAENLFSRAEVQLAGYKDYTSGFYFGFKRNKSLVGWGGHSSEGTTMFSDLALLMDKIMILKNMSDFISNIIFKENGV